MRASRLAYVFLFPGALIAIEACAPRSAPPAPSTTAGREMTTDDYHVPLSIEDVRDTMYAKLAHTHALFEGMVMEDMDQVAKNADELRSLSESTSFRPHRTVAYGVFSDEFGAIAEAIANAARRGDLESVHQKYARLTDTCVRCHSHLRTERLNLELPGAVSMHRERASRRDDHHGRERSGGWRGAV